MSRLQKKAVVALSGGVDSAVSAAILLENGFEVAGLTMAVVASGGVAAAQNDGLSGEEGPLSRIVREARRVAGFLKIPFFSVNLEKEFRDRVIHLFLQEYLEGRTPNPCAVCNRMIKFDLLREKALQLGADIFATGHYARIHCEGDRYLLKKGVDEKKDQSYFLFSLQQQQLAATLFPLGGLTKDEVRRRACRLGLPVPERGESQDICFIPDQNYVRYLENELGIQREEGDILHVSGQVLGRHQGTWRYTVGQRKGLGIAWPQPLYVIRIDAEANRVVVGEKNHLAVSVLEVRQVNWITNPPDGPFHCKCRIRYRHREAPAKVVPKEGNRAEVFFDQPQEGVTPGQAAVFFIGDLVVGGGWIQ